jgi:hypothetical protein
MRLGQENIAAYVQKRGDKTAGAVIVKLATLDGKAAVFQRSLDIATGERRWMIVTEGEEAACDASVKKQISFDPDVWVIEIEDRHGRHLLGDVGLD